VGAPLTIQRAGAAVWCTLDRPPLNLFEPTLIQAVRDAFQALASDRETRVAVITGSGRAFTAGMDVRVLRDLDTARARDLITTLHDAIAAVHCAPFPVIAAVNGACLGGGFELALACDDIIATDTATFGLPEIRLAAFPPAAAALLPLRVGASRATRAIVTGQTQDARYWHDAGLLSMVAPQSSLADAAAGWFDTHLSPHSAVALAHAISAARLTLRAQAEPALDRAERDYLGGLLKTADANEGVTAFLEKRPPQWKNR